MVGQYKARVVIVEDEPGPLKLMELMLQHEGYEVFTAMDGEQGLALVRQYLPQILITDVMLPNLDGFEMCRRLRRDPLTASIPIIFVTAMSTVGDKRAGFDLGADAYLTKPYSLQELLTQIKTTLRRMEGNHGSGRGRRPRLMLSGQLSAASVVDVLQTIAWGGLTGTLEVSGIGHGVIELTEGQLLHAQVDTPTGQLQGSKAWFRIATWREGYFELLDRSEDKPVPRTIRGPLQSLLMDAAYYRDEFERFRTTMFPGFDMVLVHHGELEADARPGERAVWEAVGTGGAAVEALLDRLDMTDLEILQEAFRLMERGLLVATISFL